jgi:hypothetical protein
MGAIESLTASWRLTGELRWLTLIGIGIVTTLIMLACLVALVLPTLFVGGPLMISIYAAAYATLAAPLVRRSGPDPDACPGCGYDLSGLFDPYACPECGRLLRS